MMRNSAIPAAFLLIFLAFSCAPNPYRATNKVYKKQAKDYARAIGQFPVKNPALHALQFVGTTNMSMRRPQLVILHHTAQNSCDQTLRTFTIPRTQVSSHYVVCREGLVYQMLHDQFRGHHAGVSWWGGQSDINSNSIGIEIDNNGSEIFPDVQIDSLMSVLHYLKTSYRLPAKAFIGHADIAPGRKVDPSRYFPWKKLADAGYGIWFDTTAVQVPENFDPMLALRVIGYNTAKPENAILSYKIKFLPSDTTRFLNESDHKILYSLMLQSL